jgi:hopanoid C-3 methylase HpnR
MRVLFVHPGPLLYTRVFLRLEPLGLELVAAAARAAGHDCRLIDLQVANHTAYRRQLATWRPDAVAFSCNYLANVPEIVDLARQTKAERPDCFIIVGGHSASFTAESILAHGDGAIDCVLRGEGEAGIVPLLAEAQAGRSPDEVPGAVSARGAGPAPHFVDDLDALHPARDLLRHRRKYFLGVLDPCASIEFSRGCPWDCSFCSAWTFYGRSYRLRSPERIVEDLRSIREPGVFIVDDVAFVHDKHGFAVGEAIARAGLHKQFYLETRGDVLLRNKEVFKFWKSLGLSYIFLGLEALDTEGLAKYRKRISLGQNFEALEFARSLGVAIAINLIADPDWDEARFAALREWSMDIPEIVNISVNTPYPGTESWLTEARKLETRDYRLFDIQHAVLPTRLPRDKFYRELLYAQRVLYAKHLNLRTAPGIMRAALRLLMRGQTNFLRGILLYNHTYNVEKMLADHAAPVAYELPLPPLQTAPRNPKAQARTLYIHAPHGRRGRAIDDRTEEFVEATRMGAGG